jgi:hypothetical protein
VYVAEEPANRLLARATILTFQQSLAAGNTAHTQPVYLPPHPDPHSVDRAVTSLAAMEKPLRCLERLHDSALILDCSVIRDQSELRIRHLQRGISRGLMGHTLSLLDQDRTSGILFEAGQTTLILTFEQYDEWVRDYYLVNIGRAVYPIESSGEAQARRFRLVVSLSAPETQSSSVHEIPLPELPDHT